MEGPSSRTPTVFLRIRSSWTSTVLEYLSIRTGGPFSIRDVLGPDSEDEKEGTEYEQRPTPSTSHRVLRAMTRWGHAQPTCAYIRGARQGRNQLLAMSTQEGKVEIIDTRKREHSEIAPARAPPQPTITRSLTFDGTRMIRVLLLHLGTDQVASSTFGLRNCLLCSLDMKAPSTRFNGVSTTRMDHHLPFVRVWRMEA